MFKAHRNPLFYLYPSHIVWGNATNCHLKQQHFLINLEIIMGYEIGSIEGRKSIMSNSIDGNY